MAGELNADEEAIADIVLATCEAVGNVITHAYGLPDGLVTLRGTQAPGEVTIRVRDNGHWRDRRDEYGGRGFILMRALMHTVEVTPGDDGTEVLMTRRLGEPVPVRPAEPHALVPPEEARDAAAIVTIEGDLDLDLDLASEPAAAARLDAAISNRDRVVVVDLSACGYVDSAGLRLLLDTAQRMHTHRQELRLVVPEGSPVARTLKLAGADTLTARFATLEAALS